MSKIKTKMHGSKTVLTQTYSHYIMRALDEFFIAEYPDKVLSSLIHLTIGIEIFIKKELENIEPKLINNKFINNNFYNELAQKNTIKEKKSFVKQNILNSTTLGKNRTVNFGNAITLFSSLKKTPKQIVNDLKFLKNIRNGVFHWEAEIDAFKFSKLFIRVIEWFFKYVIKKNGDPLSAEMATIDPMYKKRNKLKELRKFLKNENAFNVQKRIYIAQDEYQKYHYIQARVEQDVVLKPLKFISLACPACPSKRLALYKDMLQCEICDFHVQEDEYNDYAKQVNCPWTFKDLYAYNKSEEPIKNPQADS